MKKKIIMVMIVIILFIFLTPIPIPLRDGGTIEYRALTYSKPKKITLDNVIELSKKGNELTFYDFENHYLHYDIGIGMIIEKYEINKNYYLIVEGNTCKPMYIKLVYCSLSPENITKEIDIRKEDVEKFIKSNK